MKHQLLLVFILLISLVNGNDNSFFRELLKNHNIKEDEYLMLVFLEPSTCVKCYIEPIDIIKNLKNSKNFNKIKIVGVAECDREIELLPIKKSINWNYPIVQNDGSFKKSIGVVDSTMIFLFNYNNDGALILKQGDPEGNLKKILKFLKK